MAQDVFVQAAKQVWLLLVPHWDSLAQLASKQTVCQWPLFQELAHALNVLRDS
jgi:hypothetical protein